MGKLKTKKGVAKRFKLTKKGKVKYVGGGKSHLASSKKSKRIRQMRKAKTLHERKEISFVKSMLPYG
ncbi:MAG: 50S ribosomal protein L35 [Candidatus Omnitrophica bacterium]|nr:50S ribosomal protein L35 [Candidatus Omnitrophota bacterium]MBU1869339.1 50S ribosomal protein L35 [Candidatus Omnitrophota bacterium]